MQELKCDKCGKSIDTLRHPIDFLGEFLYHDGSGEIIDLCQDCVEELRGIERSVKNNAYIWVREAFLGSKEFRKDWEKQYAKDLYYNVMEGE